MLTGAAYTGEDSIYLRVEPNVESYTGKEMDFSYEERDIPVVALQKAEAPAADPGSGSVEVNTAVTLTTATEGAKIFYTTDGSEPDLTSKLYTGPILITAETVIKAIAVKAGMTNSDVAAFTYTVEVSGDDQPGTDPGEDGPGSDPGEDDPGTDPGEDQPEPIPVRSSRAAVSKPEAIRPTAARLRRIRTRITETKPLWKPATILTF